MICEVCPHHCDIKEGKTGFCRARANIRGKITCLNYGRTTSLALDPIEKKPLKRFHPGSMVLSTGSFGCNLRCGFCQNFEISMAGGSIKTVYLSPEDLVSKAVELRPYGNIGIAFTYNEPLVGYEYVRDCSILAHKKGLKTVLVTNGMICEKPLKILLPLIDAMNIDLKGFSGAFYKKISGDFETVKTAIRISSQACHVEVTTLIILGENDSAEEMEEEAVWLSSLGPEIPLHVSRFFPCYKMLDKPPTPVETVYALSEVASRHLSYVYTGNC